MTTVEHLESGYLEIWVGPMFSGKSYTLKGKLTRLKDIGFSVLIINHSFDNRSDTVISTHSSDKQCSLEGIKTDDLSKVHVEGYQVIGVDEAQFFNDLSIINHWVDDLKKTVFVVGLDGDFKQNKIGKVLDLIPKADKVEKIRAECHDCITQNKEKNATASKLIMNAPFTYRITHDDSVVHVGGKESYISLCRYHYNART